MDHDIYCNFKLLITEFGSKQKISNGKDYTPVGIKFCKRKLLQILWRLLNFSNYFITSQSTKD